MLETGQHIPDLGAGLARDMEEAKRQRELRGYAAAEPWGMIASPDGHVSPDRHAPDPLKRLDAGWRARIVLAAPCLGEVALDLVDELEALATRGAHIRHRRGPSSLEDGHYEVVRQTPLYEERQGDGRR